MAQGRSGVERTTAPNMLIDAGEVWLNVGVSELETAGSDPVGAATGVSGAVRLGATRGGNTFNPGRVLRDMEIDGAIGPVRGLTRRESSAPSLTVNLVQVTPENLAVAIAAANEATVGEFEKVTGGEVDDVQYISNVALFSTVKGSGEPFVVLLENCLVLEAPEFSFTHRGETVLAVTFTAHVLVTAPNTEAFALYRPATVFPVDAVTFGGAAVEFESSPVVFFGGV